jgi:hypothetical protein
MLLTLAATSGCASDRHGEVVFPPGGLGLDSTGRQERSLVPDTLLLVRAVGGNSDRDTTLINPYIMAGDADQIYFVETDDRILAFDTLGQLRWIRGRQGGGPGEFRNPRDLKVGQDGRLWVVDPSSGRITILARADGKVLTMLPMKVAYSPAITPLPSGFALYPTDMGSDIFYFDSMGEPGGNDSIPWPGFRQLEYLSRQYRTAVDRSSGRWVMAFIYGNGWFAFDSTRPVGGRRYYVEPTPFPPVVKERRGDKEITSLVRSTGAALDVQLLGDTVFVLFDGFAPNRRQKVDMYSWETGKYYGSFLLPEPADNIAVSRSLIAVFASNPVPKLAFYRRQKKPARH